MEVVGTGTVHLLWGNQLVAGGETYYALVDMATASLTISPTAVLPGIDRAVGSLGVTTTGEAVFVYETNLVGSSELALARLDPSLDDQDGTPADPDVITNLSSVALTPTHDGSEALNPIVVIDDQGRLFATWNVASTATPTQHTVEIGVFDTRGIEIVAAATMATVTDPDLGTAAQLDQATGTTSMVWHQHKDAPHPGRDVVAFRGLDLDGDQDALLDAEEEAIGTNLDDPDTDGDGVEDGEEVENGADPLDAGSL